MENSKSKNILIVDDQPENLKIISDYFEESQLPYNLIKAPGGKVALKIIDKIFPDLIITDWEMPEMNGIEFIQQLKRNKKTADIPVIMCTGVMTSSKNLELALQSGAMDYIRKPIDKIELIARTNASLKLVESYKRIKALNNAKNEIFTVISHDLRTPVGNIKSFVDLIVEQQERYSRAQIMEMLDVIGKQSASAFSILENLLNWANSQINNIHFQPIHQSIHKAICSSIDLLAFSAKKKNIEIINNSNPDIQVLHDYTLISVVVRNLLANAIKFTSENGCINIETETNDLHIMVSVTDNGVGINPEQVKSIFDDSHFETTRGTKSEKGSGIGLKLCKKFIDLHKGEIWVESEENKGSKFVFRIPKRVSFES